MLDPMVKCVELNSEQEPVQQCRIYQVHCIKKQDCELRLLDLTAEDYVEIFHFRVELKY